MQSKKKNQSTVIPLNRSKTAFRARVWLAETLACQVLLRGKIITLYSNISVLQCLICHNSGKMHMISAYINSQCSIQNSVAKQVYQNNNFGQTPFNNYSLKSYMPIQKYYKQKMHMIYIPPFQKYDYNIYKTKKDPVEFTREFLGIHSI